MTKLEELRVKAEELLEKAENAENIADIAKFNSELEESVHEYTAEAKRICFDKCVESGDPMKMAVEEFYFQTIRVKDNKDKDTNVITRSIEDCLKPIDLGQLHKYVKGGIGADKKWIYVVEKLNYLLTARAAKRLGNDAFAKMLASNGDAYIMQDISRSIDLGKNPLSNTNILKTVQTVVSAMLGEGYKAVSHDVNYLVDVYANDNKKSKTAVTAANHATLRNYLKKVCYRILTNGTGYDVESREVKEA